ARGGRRRSRPAVRSGVVRPVRRRGGAARPDACAGRRPGAGEGFARHPHRSRGGSPSGGVCLMLYYLHHLSPYIPVLNVTRYITFRTAAASLTALAIGLLLGPWMI